MSMIPAFSPGPQITHGASVGSFLRWMRLDLYEQCSLHMTEKMPSSTRLGSRPMALRTCSYSSALRPCCATSSGVIWDMAAGHSDGMGVALVPHPRRATLDPRSQGRQTTRHGRDSPRHRRDELRAGAEGARGGRP